METPESIRTSLQEGEWVMSIDFKDAYFHIPINPQSSKIPQVSCPGSVLPIQSSAIWSVHCSNGIHNGSQENQTDVSEQGYKNPQVPKQLVGQSHILPNLPASYSDPSSYVLGVRLDSEYEVRTGSETG